MPINFDSQYSITPKIANLLIKLESIKEQVNSLPLNPTVLASLRETARLFTTHYSTMIEGNRLTQEEVNEVVMMRGHFPGRERDELEVKNYYAALAQVEQYVAQNSSVTETVIQKLHALVMGSKAKTSPYRDGQNVIRDSTTRAIVYLPPEAKDVPKLMRHLTTWIKENNFLPCPIIAAIAHYQFATIHPYYDGNGRTARLLTALVLHLNGYGLKGLYSLEEYYARNLASYYDAISVGPSHNYYFGRAEADITEWIAYFCEGMVFSFEKVAAQMQESETQGGQDFSELLRTLDPKQRKALELFRYDETISSPQLGELFGFKPRTCSQLCHDWVEDGFLEIANPSRKARKYRLAAKYQSLL